MDLGRFHRAMHQLSDAYKKANIPAQLDQLINDLNSLAGSPSNQQVADAFKNRLETLRHVLGDFDDQVQVGAASEVIHALGLWDFVGNGLFESIKVTIADNQLSPALTAQALSQFKANLEKTFRHIVSVDSAFTELDVEYEELSDGETEISLSLPVERDEKTLSDLSREAKEWNQIVSTLSEVFDQERPQSKIRTLATGSWIFYLSSTPLVLWGIALTLRRVNQILSETIKTKELIQQLMAVNAPTKEVEAHQQKKITADLEKLAKELVKNHYKGSDSTRKNELITAASISLKNLTKKIASGSKVGLRIAHQTKPNVVDENAPTKEEQEQLAAFEKHEQFKSTIEEEIAQISYLEDAVEVAALLPAPHDDDSVK